MKSNRELFYQYLGQTSEFPLALEITHAEGIYLFDSEKRKYLDLISGIGVSALGHRHVDVIKAIKAQTDKYLHLMVYGEFIEAPQVKLAEILSSTLPDSLDNVFLVNSGSEATEGALKLSKRFTGRTKILSCIDAYHGSTHGALSVCGNEKLKQAYRPLLPETYLIPFGAVDALNQIDEETAAVIIEPIQGEAGVRMTSREYFKKLREKCTEMGCLLIFDEIQCGMGRTGKFWAHEHYGVTPDLLLTAKGLGGGMPIGAFISSREIMHKLTHDPILGHISTFGGHPVSAAAAYATCKTIRQGAFVSEATSKGELFKKLLIHPKIREVRGIGLMLAAELESFEVLSKVIDQLLKQGVLSDWFLFCDNAMRIAPPLIISEEEIKWSCDQILSAIDKVYE